MTTAIIGTGNIGSALAADLVRGGTSVLVAARRFEHAQALAADLGPAATAVQIEDAISQADTIVFAVWFDAIKELFAHYSEQLSGKVLVDPSNPITPDGNGGFTKVIPADQSAGQILSTLLPSGAHLVKAFGTMSADSLRTAAHHTPEPVVSFFAADDDRAGRVVADLITAAGFTPIRIGGIDSAIRIEVFGDLHEFGGLGKVVDRAEATAALA